MRNKKTEHANPNILGMEMERRQFLKCSALLGGSLAASSALRPSCGWAWKRLRMG